MDNVLIVVVFVITDRETMRGEDRFGRLSFHRRRDGTRVNELCRRGGWVGRGAREYHFHCHVRRRTRVGGVPVPRRQVAEVLGGQHVQHQN